MPGAAAQTSGPGTTDSRVSRPRTSTLQPAIRGAPQVHHHRFGCTDWCTKHWLYRCNDPTNRDR